MSWMNKWIRRMDELHLNLGSLDVIITDRNHPTTIISSEHEEILVLDPRDRGVLREINGHVQARRMLAGRGRVKGSLVLHTSGCLTKVIRLTVLWQVVKCLLPLNPCPGIHHGAWLYRVSPSTPSWPQRFAPTSEVGQSLNLPMTLLWGCEFLEK